MHARLSIQHIPRCSGGGWGAGGAVAAGRAGAAVLLAALPALLLQLPQLLRPLRAAKLLGARRRGARRERCRGRCAGALPLSNSPSQGHL